jgi:hypothetical protein
MLPADFDRMIAKLPAGGKMWLVFVELPHASADSAAPTAAGIISMSSAHATDEHGSPANPSADGARAMSAKSQLSALRREYGSDAALKPREWSRVTALSEREIARAIQYGALSASPKGDGRDHAARTVSIDAMEGYLSTVNAVEAGTMDPPSWWEAVRKSGIRSALSVRKSA